MSSYATSNETEWVTEYLLCTSFISQNESFHLSESSWLSILQTLVGSEPVHMNEDPQVSHLTSTSNLISPSQITSSTAAQHEEIDTSQIYGLSSVTLGLAFNVSEYCLSQVFLPERPYLLPLWIQAIWITLFCGMLVLAIGGNALVIWIVCAHRSMRTVTNYFLVNLSFADLLMSLFNTVFNFTYMLHSDWPFGRSYCKFSNFVSNVTISSSVLTLMAISCDRYIAIVKPLQPRMTKTMSWVFIISIWLISIGLAVPLLLYSTTIVRNYQNNDIRRGCIQEWPGSGPEEKSRNEHYYNIAFFTLTYVLPTVIMLCSYASISKTLWGNNHIGELTDRQANNIRSKKRVVRMFIVIVVLFSVCWLPQQIFFLYQYYDPEILNGEHIQHIYLALYWLAMSNAMINPVIYYLMNATSRFRLFFQDYFSKLMCRSRNQGAYTASASFGRRNNNSGRCYSSRSDSRLIGNGAGPTPEKSGQRNVRTAFYRDRLSHYDGHKKNGDGSCEICMQSFTPSCSLKRSCGHNGNSISHLERKKTPPTTSFYISRMEPNSTSAVLVEREQTSTFLTEAPKKFASCSILTDNEKLPLYQQNPTLEYNVLFKPNMG